MSGARPGLSLVLVNVDGTIFPQAPLATSLGKEVAHSTHPCAWGLRPAGRVGCIWCGSCSGWGGTSRQGPDPCSGGGLLSLVPKVGICASAWGSARNEGKGCSKVLGHGPRILLFLVSSPLVTTEVEWCWKAQVGWELVGLFFASPPSISRLL